VLAAGEALPAEKTESEQVLSNWDGNTVLVILSSCILGLCLSLGKEETLESPASFIALFQYSWKNEGD